MLSSKTACTILLELILTRQLFAKTPIPRVQVPRYLLNVISSSTRYLIILTASLRSRRFTTALFTAALPTWSSNCSLGHSSTVPSLECYLQATNQRACISSWNSSPTIFNKLPTELLLAVLEQLPLHAVANLALTTQWMLCTVNEIAHPFTELRLPGNRFERANFLITFDEHHPNELICYALYTTRVEFQAFHG
jgi:hypothetical protein